MNNKGDSGSSLNSRTETIPENLAFRAEIDRKHREAVEQHKRISAPILDNLQVAGFSVKSLDELCNSGTNYKAIVPTLLRWLPLVDDLGVKESIVRTLSVPWAKPLAAKPLIYEFLRLSAESEDSLKWAIGNALDVVADNSVFQEIADIVTEKKHGRSRQMVVLALGKMKDRRAEEILIKLLGDGQVEGHAIIALGKRRSVAARSLLEVYLNHPVTWIRIEAKKAISRMDETT